MNKLLVTGGSGVIGQYFSALYSPDSFIAPSKKDMPVEDAYKVSTYVSDAQPSAIVHMAALTNVDYCEGHPDEAYRVNVKGTENIVSVCNKLHIPLVYISTAAVFDGKKSGFSEHDIPSPLNVYGETKYKSEQIISQSRVDHTILRIGWLIGGGRTEKKFVSYILDKLRKGDNVQAVSDVCGSIVYAPDVVSFVRKAIIEKLRGVYHVGYTGTPSRYDIAVELKRLLNSTSSIVPVPAQTFNGTFFAKRPKREVLTSVKVPFTILWRKRLKDYVTEELL